MKALFPNPVSTPDPLNSVPLSWHINCHSIYLHTDRLKIEDRSFWTNKILKDQRSFHANGLQISKQFCSLKEIPNAFENVRVLSWGQCSCSLMVGGFQLYKAFHVKPQNFKTKLLSRFCVTYSMVSFAVHDTDQGANQSWKWRTRLITTSDYFVINSTFGLINLIF